MYRPTKCLALATAAAILCCSGCGPATPEPSKIGSAADVRVPGSTYVIHNVQFDGPVTVTDIQIIKDGGSLGATLIDARFKELSVLDTLRMVVIRPGEPIPDNPALPLRVQSAALPESPYYPPVGGHDEAEIHRMLGDWIAAASKTGQSVPTAGSQPIPAGVLAHRLEFARRLHIRLGNRLSLSKPTETQETPSRKGLAN